MSESSQNNPTSSIAGKMFFAMWLMLFVLLSYLFNIILDNQNNPNKNPTSSTLDSGTHEVVLTQNRYGHYLTNGTINNHKVTFMLDTGATDVSVPAFIAKNIGLEKGQPLKYRTANGLATVYATQLDSISIKSIKLNNIRATINPNTDDPVILLGMSFLKHLELVQHDNTLTLRQH